MAIQSMKNVLRMFPGMFYDNPRYVFWHSPECFTTFRGMFYDIIRNIWRHSPECLGAFPEMFGDIPQNVWGHSPEYNIFPIPLVPRILFPVPVFLFLYIANEISGDIIFLLFVLKNLIFLIKRNGKVKFYFFNRIFTFHLSYSAKLKTRFSRSENMKKCTSLKEQKGTRYIRGNVYFNIIVFSCLSYTKPCLEFLHSRDKRLSWNFMRNQSWFDGHDAPFPKNLGSK